MDFRFDGLRPGMILEFVIPNDLAVRQAMSVVRSKGGSVARSEWGKIFWKSRRRNPFEEKLIASAARTESGKIATVPFIEGHSEAVGKVMQGNRYGNHPMSIETGYKTNRQPFVSQDEAKRINKRNHQVSQKRIDVMPAFLRDRVHSSHLAATNAAAIRNYQQILPKNKP